MIQKEQDNIIHKYIRYMKLQRNYSGNTLEAYILDINKLLKFLKDNGISPEAAKLSDIQCFAASLHFPER